MSPSVTTGAVRTQSLTNPGASFPGDLQDRLSRADALLTAGPWLLLAADNRRAGYAKSAAAARRAVVAGEAATWAAVPRHGVTAVDLDASPYLCQLAADFLTDWCRARDLWHIVRASGRAGHLHLWVYSHALTDDLADYADAVRRELGLTRPQLDVRSAKPIRPLAAPHRSGGPALADQLTAECLADLVARLDGRTLAPRQHRTADPAAPDTCRRRARLRRRRAAVAAAPTGDRSRDEWDATLAAYNAGQSADEAWQHMADLDGHSAARGRRWWQRCMWDKIRPAHGRGDRPALVDAAQGSLPAIRARLAVLPDLDTRQAHSLDAVLWVVGERIATTTEPQPVSERDVRGATGLARPTIRAALARAVAAGILVRHDPSRPDDALAWTAGPAMLAQRAENDPPCLTPTAAAWLHTLPRGAATALTLHLTGAAIPARLAAALAAILAVVQHPDAVQPAECPAWPTIRAERDSYHQQVRDERTAYAARWQADRAAAHRRDRAHALAWQREHLARLDAEHRAQHPQPTLPRLDCLPGSPRGRVMWTARATAPAHPAHSARSDHRPAHRPAHPPQLASSHDAWTAPRTAPWTASTLDQTPPPATTTPHGRQQTAR